MIRIVLLAFASLSLFAGCKKADVSACGGEAAVIQNIGEVAARIAGESLVEGSGVRIQESRKFACDWLQDLQAKEGGFTSTVSNTFQSEDMTWLIVVDLEDKQLKLYHYRVKPGVIFEEEVFLYTIL